MKRRPVLKMINRRAVLSVFIIFTVITTGIFITTLLYDLEKTVNRNESIKVFQQAMAVVSKNYVEELNQKDLIHSALNGMIGSMNQHPSFMNQDQHKEVWLDKAETIISKILDVSETQGDGNKEAKVLENALTMVRENFLQNEEHDIDPQNLIHSALNGMLKSLDPHSAFMTPEQYSDIQIDTRGEFGGIGIQTAIKKDVLTVIASLEGTPASRAGIKAGDKIMMVNNESTADMSLQDGVEKMRGTPSTTVKLTILRDGWKEKKDFVITREIIKIKTVKSRMLADGIGYIKINQFQQQTAADFSASLSTLMSQHMNALILDLRDNPGGLLRSAVKVAGQFIPPGELVVYTKNKHGRKKEYRNNEDNPNFSIPIVVLVNEGSASASEIVAGALKDWGRATIMGSLTFGKGSVQSIVPLKDGSALRLTTARYYTPKGISIQTTGISPDFLIKGKQRVHPVIREKDLEGHQKNGQTEQFSPSSKIVLCLKENDEDQQIQRAIEFLKNKTVQIASPDVLQKTSVKSL